MPTVAMRSRPRLLAVCLPLLAVAAIIATLPDASHILASLDGRQGVTPYGAAAMRASIDPETGMLSVNPTPPEPSKMLETALSRSSEGLVRETMPNGTVRLNLQGRFMNASVAHLDAQGHVQTSCTEDLDQAECFLEGTSPQASRKAEVK
jgi:hypothetical protein